MVSWPVNGAAPSPFHNGPEAALRQLSRGQAPQNHILIDLAHTYARAGLGKDWLASVLVFVAVRCSIFGSMRRFEDQLDAAYSDFRQWCRLHQKATTIQDFGKTELKITSRHGNPKRVSVPPRLQQYPGGLGKGSDSALVGAWLDDTLRPWSAEMVPAPLLTVPCNTQLLRRSAETSSRWFSGPALQRVSSSGVSTGTGHGFPEQLQRRLSQLGGLFQTLGWVS